MGSDLRKRYLLEKGGYGKERRSLADRYREEQASIKQKEAAERAARPQPSPLMQAATASPIGMSTEQMTQQFAANAYANATPEKRAAVDLKTQNQIRDYTDYTTYSQKYADMSYGDRVKALAALETQLKGMPSQEQGAEYQYLKSNLAAASPVEAAKYRQDTDAQNVATMEAQKIKDDEYNNAVNELGKKYSSSEYFEYKRRIEDAKARGRQDLVDEIQGNFDRYMRSIAGTREAELINTAMSYEQPATSTAEYEARHTAYERGQGRKDAALLKLQDSVNSGEDLYSLALRGAQGNYITGTTTREATKNDLTSPGRSAGRRRGTTEESYVHGPKTVTLTQSQTFDDFGDATQNYEAFQRLSEHLGEESGLNNLRSHYPDVYDQIKDTLEGYVPADYTDPYDLSNDLKSTPFAQYINEDEWLLFYALLGEGTEESKQAAVDYINQLKPTLSARAVEAKQQEVQQRIKDAPPVLDVLLGGAYAGKAVVNSAFGAIPAFADLAVQYATTGEYDPNTPWNAVKTNADIQRSAVGQNIEESLGSFGKIGNFLYNTASSIAESIFGAGTFGKLFSFIMGTGAGATRARELYERGVNGTELFIGALSAAVNETLFEHLSLEMLLKADPKTTKQFITQIFKQGGVEGSEELFTEIANDISGKITLGKDSEYEEKIRQLLNENPDMTFERAKTIAGTELIENAVLSTLAGALSGGGTFAGYVAPVLAGNVAARASYSNQTRGIGKNIASQYKVSDTIEKGLEYDKNSAVYKAAADLQDRIDKGKSISNKEVGELGRYLLQDETSKAGKAYTEASTTINKASSENAVIEGLTERGLSEDDAKKYVNLTQKAINDQELTESEREIYDSTPEIQDYVDSVNKQISGNIDMLYESGEFINAATKRGMGSTKANDYVKREAKLDKIHTEAMKHKLDKVSISQADVDNVNKLHNYTVSESGKTEYEGKPVDIDKVKSIKDGVVTVELSNGETAKLSDVKFGTKDEAVIWETLSGIDGITPETLYSLANMYDAKRESVSAGEWAQGVKEGYEIGRKGSLGTTQFAKDENAARYLHNISNEARYKSERDGRLDVRRNTKAENITTKREEANVKKGEARGEEVKRATDMLDRLGRKYEVKPGMKGDGYIKADGTIVLNENAADPIAFVLKHELTHFGEGSKYYGDFVSAVKKSSAFAEWLDGHVVEEGTQAEQEEAYIRNIQARYARQGVHLTNAAAHNEMIANFVGDTLFTEKGVGLEGITKDMSVKDRNAIVRLIKKFIDYIKRKLGGKAAEIARLEKMYNQLQATSEGQRGEGNYSFTETDQKYLAAVNSGDMETAQRMVDEAAKAAGYTVRGYHGTTNFFTVFDKSKANPEGDMGAGFYFTTSEDDVEENYANNEGADLTNKIEHLAEMLEYDDTYENLSYEEREKVARKMLSEGEPRVIQAALKVENPVVLGKGRSIPSTFLDLTYDYDEENDEYGEPEGKFVDFIEALRDIAADYDADSYTYDKIDSLLNEGLDYEGLDAEEAVRKAKEIFGEGDFVDDNSLLVGNEMVRQALENIGFDAIIDNMVGNKFRRMNGVYGDTSHIIVFNPGQVKLSDPVTYDDNGNVIPLSERFNEGNEDIRWSLSEKSDVQPGFTAKEVKKLNETVQQLKDMLELQKTETHGTVFTKASVARAASALMNKWDVYVGKGELIKMLNDFYTTLAQKTNARVLMWDDVEEAARPIVDFIQNKYAQTKVIENPSYGPVLDYLKNYKLKLNEPAMVKIKATYDSYEKWRSMIAGTFKISNDAHTISNNWDEISALNADLFDPTIDNEGDMIVALTEGAIAARDNQLLDDYRQDEYEDDRRNILFDVYESFFDANPVQTLTDKHVREVANIRAQAFNKIEELREKAAVQFDNLKAEDRERLKKLRAEKNAKIEQIKAENRERRAKERERRKKAQLRDEIKERIADFNTRLFHAVPKKYIPVEFVNSVAHFLKEIDLGAKPGTKVSEKIAALKAKYEALQKDPYYSAAYNEIVGKLLQKLAEEVKDTPLPQMSAYQLELLNNTLKAIKHRIVKAVSIDSVSKSKYAFEYAKELMRELYDVTPSALTGTALGKLADWQMRPENFFERLAGFKKNSYWSQLYKALDEAQLRETQLSMEAQRMFSDLLQDVKNFKRLADEVDLGFTDENGDPVTISRGMMLSIRRALMNADNTRHIVGGGFTVPDFKEYYKGKTADAFNKKGKRVFGFASDYADVARQLEQQREVLAEQEIKGEDTAETKAQIAELEKRLDEIKEKSNAYAAQLAATIDDQLTTYEQNLLAMADVFFDDWSKNVLNDTTLSVYGYKKANVDKYFPIKVNNRYLETKFDTFTNDISLENAGFMKDRVVSSKPVMLEDITDVISDQIKKVSKYAAYLQVIDDFKRIYNSTMPGSSDSVKDALAKRYRGTDAEKYIDNLIQDIQGGRRGGTITLFDKARSKLAQATLTLNARVALAQAASFPTAAAELGWAPVMKALKKTFNKTDKELIMKWSPLLAYRSWGYSSTEIGDARRIKDIRHNVNNKLRWLTGWITAVDSYTVGHLWYAAEYYVDANNKDLEKGSDAYYEEVAKVFNRVIEKTQPNYTTLQRPELMRTDNALLKQLSMFMTQRLQNVNILYESFARYNKYKKDYKAGKNGVTLEDVKEARKARTRAIESQIVAAATISIIKNLTDILLHSFKKRDDDDDYDLADAGWNALDALLDSLISNVVLGSEAYSFAKSKITGDRYYGVSLGGVNSVTEVVEDASSFVDAVKKVFNGEEMNWKAAKNLGYSMSRLLGIPAQNAVKYVEAIYNWTQDAKSGQFNSGNYFGKTGVRLYLAEGRTDEAIKEINEQQANGVDMQSTVRDYYKPMYLEAKKSGDKATMTQIGRDLDKIIKETGVYKKSADKVLAGWVAQAENDAKEKNK